MQNAIQRRIYRQFSQLIKNGGAYHIARMACSCQGVGASGLDRTRAATTFELRFTASDKGLPGDARDRQMGVSVYLDTPYLSDKSEEALVRRLEDIAGITDGDRWTLDEDDDFGPEAAIEALLSEYPTVDRIVRGELLDGLLDRDFLLCNEEAIETEIANLIDCRQQMHVEREQREQIEREREQQAQFDRELVRQEREQQMAFDRELVRQEREQQVQIDRELARQEREQQMQSDREQREQRDREGWRIEFPEIVQLQLRRFSLAGGGLRAAAGASDQQRQPSATLRGSHDE